MGLKTKIKNYYNKRKDVLSTKVTKEDLEEKAKMALATILIIYGYVGLVGWLVGWLFWLTGVI